MELSLEEDELTLCHSPPPSEEELSLEMLELELESDETSEEELELDPVPVSMEELELEDEGVTIIWDTYPSGRTRRGGVMESFQTKERLGKSGCVQV